MSKDIQDKQVLKEKYIINKLKKVLPVKCSKHFNFISSDFGFKFLPFIVRYKGLSYC